MRRTNKEGFCQYFVPVFLQIKQQFNSMSSKKSNGPLSKSSYAKICRLVATLTTLMHTNNLETSDNLLTIAMQTNPTPSGSFYELIYNMLSISGLTLPVILVALKYTHQYVCSNTNSIKDPQLLITIAAMTANKFLDDLRLSNTWWSRTSGIPLDVLNRNELLFLTDIAYTLHLSDKEYVHVLD